MLTDNKLNTTVENTSYPWRVDGWFGDLDKACLIRLKILHQEVLKFNASMALVSRKTENDTDLIHVADSVIASQHILKSTEAKRIFDIGSGNGFPGLVIAALDPSRQIVCVDSNAKKTEFIRHTASKMKLDNVEVALTRFEDLKEGLIECAVSRGFANISKSILLARKPLALDAQYFHMKSNTWAREVGEIPSQLCSLWSPRLVCDYYLPQGGHQLSLVVTTRIKL